MHAVLRHVGVARLAHGEAQAWIRVDIGAAESRRHRDLLDEPREHLALLRIRGRLAVLDVGPFAVTRHSMILAPWPPRSSSPRTISRRSNCSPPSPTVPLSSPPPPAP